jgi:hypothetical protein
VIKTVPRAGTADLFGDQGALVAICGGAEPDICVALGRLLALSHVCHNIHMPVATGG